MKKWILLLALCFPFVGRAQTYTIDWHKVAGGGGNSSGTNGSTVYTVSGTVGQQDASRTLTGGTFALTGGFWSLISVVQLPGSPLLNIERSNNSVVVWWNAPATGYYLETNGTVKTNTWGFYPGSSIVTNAGVISTTITPPVGNLFFRLGPL